MATRKKNTGQESLAQHKKYGGKLSVESKVPLKTKNDWSTYYTPGIAAVASHLAQHPEAARTHSIKKNTVAVISDGSAVLGLGNIGPYGALPVMEGKAAIFKTMADIDAFPIVLDTQDTDAIIETIVNLAPGFGGINLEDISAPKCFEVEERLKKRLAIPVMHDDQHGTAIVVLAALTNALKVVKKKKDTASVAILGAGAAGNAIAQLLAYDGYGDIAVVDSRGVITKARKDLAPHKKKLARLPQKRKGLVTALDAVSEADVLIGVSGPNTVSKEMVAAMAEDAIVFALANPIPEILPTAAHAAGARVVATGRSDFPNQVNNALVFPGIFRGALDKQVSAITDEMKVKAAHALARLVAKPTAAKIVPAVSDPRVVKAVAKAV
ncbi:MAG: NADP-dependent malic enzyme [Patescibacteria group bacterium UBA2163]